ncbi:MAG: hypothetical protein FJ033_03400 [Chloroflexi bacterium]|nr:hypothetical protein [Chloroflexota bacterium]
MDALTLAATVTGVAGLGAFATARLLHLDLDPRPCWQKNDCTMKRDNAEACARCTVYRTRDIPVEHYLTRELNLPPLRSFVDEGAARAA